VSYAELDRDSNRLANFLLGVGVRPGDVVSVQLPNWYETVVVDLGIMKAGAVINPMLPNYRAKELRYMLGVGGVDVLFTPATYRKFDHAALGAELGVEHHVVVDDGFGDWLAGFSDAAPGVPRAAGEVSELIFTSGTEAEPKAIMHTEQTTNFSARAVASSLGVREGDVVWMPSPIGHSTGLNYGVRVALYHGAPLVLQDAWSPEEAVALIERFRCAYSVVATTFVADIVDLAARRPCDLSSLRLFGSGGAPIPPEVVTASEALGMRVLRLYGSTEALMVTTNRPDSAEAKRIETDGCALDHVEVEVRDDEGRAVVGAPGEIHVRGPNTSVGFYADPDRTAAVYEPDGWVRSGDLGVLDADGYLAIVGRKKEIIIRGGINIAPREIEDLVIEHPDVAETAVVGLPHPRLGEMTCACVVLREGATLELSGLTDFLSAHGMATYKLPQRLEVLDGLPRTPSGKVKKFELVAQLSA
jgi:acyl-coenzyme A synthetase/AMP-(fatty) acid ligase